MRTEILEDLGLTASEGRVYLALLHLGQSTAGPIVDEARVTRSKIYDILERLKQKGLVSFITKQKTKYFSASNPQQILSYIDEKEKRVQEERKKAQELIPKLLLEQEMNKHKKTGEIFIGFKGMESAFQELVNDFEDNTPYHAFGANSGKNHEKAEKFFAKLQKERDKKNISMKIIYNTTLRGKYQFETKNKLVDAKYYFDQTPTSINIYKDKTVILIFNEEPITILINNKEAADSFRKYFEAIWKIAKK